jgi:hypothetical protein
MVCYSLVALAVVATLCFFTTMVSRTLLFWATFILTPNRRHDRQLT